MTLTNIVLLNVVVVPGSGLINPQPAAMLIFSLQIFGAGLAAFRPVSVQIGAEIFRAKIPLPPGFRHVDMNTAGYIAPQIALEDGLEVVSKLDWIGASAAKIIAMFVPLSVK